MKKPKTAQERDKLIEKLQAMTFEPEYPVNTSELQCDWHRIGVNYENAQDLIRLDYLITARDEYNRIDNFKPDWSDSEQKKFVIRRYSNYIYLETSAKKKSILAFGSSKTRDIFLENFRELIEKCNLI